MDRRRFFTAGTGAGMIGLASPLLSSCREPADVNTDELRIGSVITAMLSVQRKSWEQGVCSQALLEMGRTDSVLLMVEEAVLHQDSQGRLANVASDEAVTDPASNGEPVLFAYHQTRNEIYKKAADGMLIYLLEKAPRTKDGIIHHITGAPQLWIDSMYMAPPFIAASGKYEEAVKQVEGYRKYLWNADAKLFSHMWDEEKNAFARADFWGVGNGWAMAGMYRVAAALPDTMQAERERLIGYITEAIDGCLKHLRGDGFFHDVVDKPDTFIETNLSQMLAYTIFRCVRKGWLDKSYLAAAENMRSAAISKVDELGMVRDVCGSPNFNRAGYAAEGQAFHLLMEAAHRDLA